MLCVSANGIRLILLEPLSPFSGMFSLEALEAVTFMQANYKKGSGEGGFVDKRAIAGYRVYSLRSTVNEIPKRCQKPNNNPGLGRVTLLRGVVLARRAIMFR